MLNVSKLHKTIVLAIFSLGSIISYSQDYNLEVSSFSLEENSLTAKNEPVRDTNNQKCALVIITGFGNENLRFNVGNTFSKVDEKKDDQGERVYLLWIPEGTVKVVISSDSKNFAPVEYFFNPRVKKAETYLMDVKISTAKSLAGKQYLQFQISPMNAYLEVNDEPWDVKNGIAYRQLPRGIYNYRVQAKDYHPEVGTVDFSDLSVKKEVAITLKPNFGWLTITPPSGIEGLTVIIDNEISSSGLNRIKLASGGHTLKVTRESYLPFTQTINIEDDKEIKLTPTLTANFSTVTITAQGGSSIYIDDKLVGTNSWSGPLSVGSYAIDIKKDNHKSTNKTISIPKIGETYTFEFKELVPILGSASVETNPPGALVKIDGKEYGKTPVFIPELIIGNHSVNITLKDYKSYSGPFSVEEGKQIDLSYNLEKGVDDPAPTVPKQQSGQNNSQNNSPSTSPIRENTHTGMKKKYAIMDSQSILESMPEYASLQRQIAERQQQVETTLAQLQEKLDKAYDAYQKKSSSKNSDTVITASNALNNFKDNAQKELEKFQKEEIEKLTKKITYAANIVGRENGYEVIFPTGVALYTGPDVIDATELVKQKVNY